MLCHFLLEVSRTVGLMNSSAAPGDASHGAYGGRRDCAIALGSDEQDTVEVRVYSAENLLLKSYERASIFV